MSDGNEFEEPNILLPEKSRKVYEKCYEKFMEWRASQNIVTINENVLLKYFQELSAKFKSSTLWAEYSMLKATISIHHRADISKYYKLLALLKRQSQGFQSKKSKTFLPSEMMRFLNEAPDKKYLSMKIALIFGIMGACRRQELYKLKFDEVKDLESLILVNISDSKTKINRTFTITGKYYEKCKQYMMLRPNPCTNPSFFLKYINGKCFPHNIGINKFGLMGKVIATYLGLPNPELYTGHCFRRTSATILIDAGGDITPKHRGGKWASPTVAVENSIQKEEVPVISSPVYLCISCLKEITRFRYRCLVCPNYEMCGECERRGGHHDDHYVLRVPMQRPTVEVEHVETTLRRALSSLPVWKPAENVKVVAMIVANPPSRKKPKTAKKRATSRNYESDTTDTDSSEAADEPEETVNHSMETVNQSNETDDVTKSLLETVTIKQEVVEFNEVEVKVEHIKKEMDPLDEEEEESDCMKNNYELEIESEDVPLSHYSRHVPPKKKRRDDDPSTATNFHATICKNEESEENNLRGTTSLETDSRNKVFELKKKKTRPENQRDTT